MKQLAAQRQLQQGARAPAAVPLGVPRGARAQPALSSAAAPTPMAASPAPAPQQSASSATQHLQSLLGICGIGGGGAMSAPAAQPAAAPPAAKTDGGLGRFFPGLLGGGGIGVMSAGAVPPMPAMPAMPANAVNQSEAEAINQLGAVMPAPATRPQRPSQGGRGLNAQRQPPPQAQPQHAMPQAPHAAQEAPRPRQPQQVSTGDPRLDAQQQQQPQQQQRSGGRSQQNKDAETFGDMASSGAGGYASSPQQPQQPQQARAARGRAPPAVPLGISPQAAVQAAVPAPRTSNAAAAATQHLHALLGIGIGGIGGMGGGGPPAAPPQPTSKPPAMPAPPAAARLPPPPPSSSWPAPPAAGLNGFSSLLNMGDGANMWGAPPPQQLPSQPTSGGFTSPWLSAVPPPTPPPQSQPTLEDTLAMLAAQSQAYNYGQA